jgi:hypothetical protein
MPEPLKVKVPRVLSADEATAMVGDDVPPAEPTLTGATVAVDADTDRPVFAYLPLPQVAELRRAVIRLDYGEGMIRANGVRNRARAFGYGPRRPVYRREGCSATALANEYPHEHQVITGYADQLAAMLPLIDDDIAKAAHLAVAEVSPDWRLGRSKLWTSGVINQSAVLPWHRDAFNFPAWSAMPVLRRHIDGGYLRILEYGAVIPCRDGWGVFFAGYELVHGVTPMRLRRDDGYRYSIVYYALKGMKNCFEAAEETRYAKRRRTEREQDMAANLAAGNKQIHNLSPGRGAGLRTMGGRQQAQFPKVERAGDPTAIEDAYVASEAP